MAFADESLIVDVAVADDYHSARGNAAWAKLDAIAKQSALIRATDYVEMMYGARFVGEKISLAQQLSWPRRGVAGVSVDEIPSAVEKAVCELALRAGSKKALIVDEGRAVKRKKTDVLETEYEAGSSAQPSFPVVEKLLASLLRCASAGQTCVKLVRV
jgi:hypothetical protein